MKKARIFGTENNGMVCINCPGCGTFHVIATSVPLSNGAVWNFNGNFEKPTFTPSLLVKYPSFETNMFVCHSFITDGKIQFLTDSTHKLSGQTVDLPDVDED